MQERLSAGWGVPGIWSSAFLVVAGGVVIVALLVFLVPLLMAQAQQAVVALPAELERGHEAVGAMGARPPRHAFSRLRSGLNRAAGSLTENWGAFAGIAAKSLWDRGLAVFNFISLLLVTPLVVFYLLVVGTPWWLRSMAGCLAITLRRSPARRRDQRRGVGLHSRPGDGLPCARGLLRHGTDGHRSKVWAADRPRHRGVGFVPFIGWRWA